MMMLDGFGQKALYGRSFWVGFGAQGTCGYCLYPIWKLIT